MSHERGCYQFFLTIKTIQLIAGSSTFKTSTIEDTITEIEWKRCNDSDLSLTTAECGVLSVPLDYAQPQGTKIQLALSRIKHSVADKQFQGVILLNPGGPGGSGLSLVTVSEYLPLEVRHAYDWIGFDPRGVGYSEPAISCLPYYRAGPRPNEIPWDQKREDIWLQRSRDFAFACARNHEKLLEHMTTLDVVKDMDRIRIALGQKQINYYGFSYGTYLGQVYATLFPNRVKRMVLDSNTDPRSVWFQSNLDQNIGFDRNIRIWFRWLAKYDSVYHLGSTEGEVEYRWNRVLEDLETKPANNTIGPTEWIDVFLLAGYAQPLWDLLGQAFSQWVNYKDPRLLLLYYLSTNSPGDDNSYAVYLAVICTDAKWPQSWEHVRLENWRTFAKAPIITWNNAWFNGPCQYWPANAGKPVNVDGAQVKDVLLIGETLDAATPFEGNLEVRRRFPTARLIATPNGTSHATSPGFNPCVDNFIVKYLLSAELPPRKDGNEPDVLCESVAEPVPVALNSLRLANPEIKDLIQKHVRPYRRQRRQNFDLSSI